MSVLIRGDGIAARCCQRLLNRGGLATVTARDGRPPVPALLLADSALALIRDVFGDPSLFQDAPRIRHRVVAWNPAVAPVTLPHSAVLISERLLLESLELAPLEQAAQSNWTVYASRPLPPETAYHSFGTRMASGVRVSLRPDAPAETCWIESLPEGWLFLVPGWLLAVGSGPDRLLRDSRLIAAQIADVYSEGGTFAAYPRIASPLCAEDWVACGTAAMAFDPICGDGTAHAVREGILASAVIQSHGDPAQLAQHYDARLTAGFERHLQLCLQFYQSGHGGPWWERERTLTEEGLAWCAARLAAHGAFRYRLNGFGLEALVR